MGRVRFRGRDWGTVMLIQDQQKMLIQEHILLGKITATVICIYVSKA